MIYGTEQTKGGLTMSYLPDFISKPWLSYGEAAQLLGVSVATFYRLAATHQFTTLQQGKGKVWKSSDLLEYRSNHSQVNTPINQERAPSISESAKLEFFQLYGAFPFERPDLLDEWCALLVRHRRGETSSYTSSRSAEFSSLAV
jgi:excisionase family DNA binding protein